MLQMTLHLTRSSRLWTLLLLGLEDKNVFPLLVLEGVIIAPRTEVEILSSRLIHFSLLTKVNNEQPRHLAT
jgi:hypothetical protein